MTAEEFFHSNINIIAIDSCMCDCGNYSDRQMIEFAEEYAKHKLNLPNDNGKFYMSSRSGNAPDYKPFGNHDYKQYDI